MSGKIIWTHAHTAIVVAVLLMVVALTGLTVKATESRHHVAPANWFEAGTPSWPQV